MKRTLSVLLLGLGVGLATHLAYFHYNEPAAGDSLDGHLAWMKRELNLSDAQYARIRDLHQESSPRLRELASEVAQLQAEFAAFENTRRTTDKVDFIEFAAFVELRRAINERCIASTRQLVLASADVMTPEQRAHYLGLVALSESLHSSHN